MGAGSPTKININFKLNDLTYVMNNVLTNSSIKNLFQRLGSEISVPFDILKKDMAFQFEDDYLIVESNETLKEKKFTDNSTIIIYDGNNKLTNNKNFLKKGELTEKKIHSHFEIQRNKKKK